MTSASAAGRTRLILVLAVFVIVLIAVGGPIWTAHNEYLASPVVVTGTIRDSGGVARPEINVQVYRWQHRQWDAIAAADTDALGHYRFSSLTAGRYTIALEDDSGAGYLESWFGGGLTAARAKYRTVSPGATAVLDSEVVLGAAITGRATFTDPDRGVVDATQFDVVAYPLIPNTDGGFATLRETAQVSSLAPTSGGNWRIQNLRTGSYVLQAVDGVEYPAQRGQLGQRWIGVPASAPYSFGQWRQAEVFTVVNGRVYTAPSVNLTYADPHPQPALVLRAMDSTGRPIDRARLTFTLVGAGTFAWASGVHGAPLSGPDGSFRIYRPTPGRYALTLSAPGYQTLSTTFVFSPGQSGTSATTLALRQN